MVHLRPARRGVRPDRLTTPDLAMLWPEDHGWPQDVGLLAVVDGKGLFDAADRFRIEDLRSHVKRRLHLLPARFQKLLVRPQFGLGLPYWVDTPAIDLTHHVRHLALPGRVDDDGVLAACETLRLERFDRNRPLWEFWFLTGLPSSRVALFAKAHHSLVDGVAGITALTALVDAVPVGDPPAAWTPAPAPSTFDLARDAAERQLQRSARALRTLARARTYVSDLRSDWRAWRRVLGYGSAPRTSLNRPIGVHRRAAVVRGDLALHKAIARAHGATVNDVLLATVAHGLHDLLARRGEPVDGLVVRAMVPISLHGRRDGPPDGNADAGMVVPLPLGEADPVRLLRRIADDTTERKRDAHRVAETTRLYDLVFLPRLALRVGARQRVGNVYVANVPGAPVAVSVAGAPVLEVFPMVPLMGNMTLGVGALSYAGQFNVTIVADRDTCPDRDVFVAGLRRALKELARSVPYGLPEHVEAGR